MSRANERGTRRQLHSGLSNGRKNNHSYILESVLEREPGSGSMYCSAYGCIIPTRRLTCVYHNYSLRACSKDEGHVKDYNHIGVPPSAEFTYWAHGIACSPPTVSLLNSKSKKPCADNWNEPLPGSLADSLRWPLAPRVSLPPKLTLILVLSCQYFPVIGGGVGAGYIAQASWPPAWTDWSGLVEAPRPSTLGDGRVR